MTLDIVCQVVDNYGDISVSWRLAQALVEDGGPNLTVRLLVDDWASFQALVPAVDPDADHQEVACRGGTVVALRSSRLEALDRWRLDPADVIVEAFGAPTPVAWLEAFLAAAASGHTPRKRILLHLEYLTAEAWSESYHRLPSPVGRPGVDRYFFVPGFRAGAGGLVFNNPRPVALERGPEDWLMTLFSYEHDFTRFWDDLAEFLAERNQTARVLVFAGRSRAGALGAWERVRDRRGGVPAITVVDQPFVDQQTYTALLNAGDFHVVRGEESWVQAVLSGKAFLWHAYLQPEGHQSVKVEAFLEVWRAQFDPGDHETFDRIAAEFRAFNRRLVNSDTEKPVEGYRVFWENRALLETIGARWAADLRKNAKLSTKMLEFLEKVRV
jgi:uncharacterized repeat protein (TIGR03837 family)